MVEVGLGVGGLGGDSLRKHMIVLVVEVGIALENT